jgi:glycosyltransferase involved in cell wall biosynthesis
MRLVFATWVSAAPSGGNLYDQQLIMGLRALGVDVVVRQLPGHDAHASLREALDDEPISIVDGIVAVEAPDIVEEVAAAGRQVVIVVHHFGADDPGLEPDQRARYEKREARALHAAAGVLCTSRWAAAELERRYGLSGVGVAAPGVELASVSPGSRGINPRLMALGSLTPTKDQLTLVAALDRVRDLPWTASLVGSDDVDPAYAGRVRDMITESGLGDRMSTPGALIGDPLEAEWALTDLLVHPSRSETYGIAVLEALARGIPAIVTAGTGTVEALSAGDPQHQLPGATVPPGDVDAWATRLRRWLTDPTESQTWRDAALARRPALPRWHGTASAVHDYLKKNLRL